MKREQSELTAAMCHNYLLNRDFQNTVQISGISKSFYNLMQIAS